MYIKMPKSICKKRSEKPLKNQTLTLKTLYPNSCNHHHPSFSPVAHSSSPSREKDLVKKPHVCRKLAKRRSDLQVAAGGGEGPASQAVGDVDGVAGGAGDAVVEVAVVDGAAVVHAGGGVDGLGVGVAEDARGGGEGLLEAVAGGGAGGAVGDHLEDGGGGAGVDAVAAAGPVVRLHEARVDDAVVGGRGPDAPLGLLHHDRQDEALVDARLPRHLLDRRVDVGDLRVRVVRPPPVPPARVLHHRRVGRPELVVRAPAVLRRPPAADRPVALVERVGVGDGALGGLGRGGAGDGREGGDSDSKLSVHFEKVGDFLFVCKKGYEFV